MKYQLTEAFRQKNADQILRISADLGHYIGDANVPLHTTENYNGQLTGQYGIHGFWESRLPELFADQYDYFFEPARYERHPNARAWKAVTDAHAALDSVLGFERELTLLFGDDKKFSFETRNGITTKVYSKEFSEAYHQKLAGQVERRMRAAIQMVGDFWLTAWIEAGQPNLDGLKQATQPQEPTENQQEPPLKARPHDTGSLNPRMFGGWGMALFRKKE